MFLNCWPSVGYFSKISGVENPLFWPFSKISAFFDGTCQLDPYVDLLVQKSFLTWENKAAIAVFFMIPHRVQCKEGVRGFPSPDLDRRRGRVRITPCQGRSRPFWCFALNILHFWGILCIKKYPKWPFWSFWAVENFGLKISHLDGATLWGWMHLNFDFVRFYGWCTQCAHQPFVQIRKRCPMCGPQTGTFVKLYDLFVLKSANRQCINQSPAKFTKITFEGASFTAFFENLQVRDFVECKMQRDQPSELAIHSSVISASMKQQTFK